jgi:ribosomal subunit interface protein
MIKRLELTWLHESSEKSIEKYVQAKIGQLDRYVPRRDRQAVHAKVTLKKSKAQDKRQYGCEVILTLPRGRVLKVDEASLNTYAAIDISEAKLKHQLLKYKELYGTPKFHRRVLARFRRSPVDGK